MQLFTSVAEAVERIGTSLVGRRAGLFSDFDGTLSMMAATPKEASIAPGAREALASLSGRLDVVGIVTGRGLFDAQEMVALPDLLYVGNHGLEWSEHGQHHVHPAGLAAESEVTAAFAEIERRLGEQLSTTGMLFEHKRLSGSIHYRMADDRDRIGPLLEVVGQDVAAEHGLRVTVGKMMIELRPTAIVSKGTALGEQAERNNLEAVVFLGDDITDVDGFVALHEMRDAGLVTCAVGVLTPDTASPVIETSDILLNGVEDVVAVLTDLGPWLDAHR